MRLLRHFLVVERRELMEQNVQLRMIGRREGCRRGAGRVRADRRADGLERRDDPVPGRELRRPCEIADAARRLAEDVRAGRIDPDQVGEEMFASYLYTAGMSDPDLLIRTAGEMRISNFLLWQISYSEIWVTPTLWPEFRGDDLMQACLAFAARERKFGGLPCSTAGVAP